MDSFSFLKSPHWLLCLGWCISRRIKSFLIVSSSRTGLHFTLHANKGPGRVVSHGQTYVPEAWNSRVPEHFDRRKRIQVSKCQWQREEWGRPSAERGQGNCPEVVGEVEFGTGGTQAGFELHLHSAAHCTALCFDHLDETNNAHQSWPCKWGL